VDGPRRPRQGRRRHEPGLSRRFGISGIPAVKSFWQGEVVHEFVGAQPPALVARLFDALVDLATPAAAEATG
jgi:thioredoxin-like negative regulator of GroEL